jgi:hypothetical protein
VHDITRCNDGGHGVCWVLRDTSSLQGQFAAGATKEILAYNVMIQAALYSAKLKLEFWILNQLTIMSSSMLQQSQVAISGDYDEVYSTYTSKVCPSCRSPSTVAPYDDTTCGAVSSNSAKYSSLVKPMQPYLRGQEENWSFSSIGDEIRRSRRGTITDQPVP